MCNLLAMTYLQQGGCLRRVVFHCNTVESNDSVVFKEDFGMVLELLKKAEILTERDDAGRAVTFNNLACYYRRYHFVISFSILICYFV